MVCKQTYKDLLAFAEQELLKEKSILCSFFSCSKGEMNSISEYAIMLAFTRVEYFVRVEVSLFESIPMRYVTFLKFQRLECCKLSSYAKLPVPLHWMAPQRVWNIIMQGGRLLLLPRDWLCFMVFLRGIRAIKLGTTITPSAVLLNQPDVLYSIAKQMMAVSRGAAADRVGVVAMFGFFQQGRRRMLSEYLKFDIEETLGLENKRQSFL